jgi:hypothetical protein
MFELQNAADPMRDVQGNIDPLITSLVVGAPFRRRFPSELILRNITVDNWTFAYQVYGYEKFLAYDTERSLRAEIRTSERKTTQATGKLRRFTHAMVRDEDELANAAANMRVRELDAIQARYIVMSDIERIIQTLLTTTTNYPASHRLAIAGGSEWNAAGGDSRANIQAQASAIAADTGVSIGDVSVFLTDASFNAALSDPKLLTALHYSTTDTANETILARYWGVREVVVANPITYSAAGVVSALYADIAILFVRDVNGADWDTTYGDFNFAVNFRWNKGTALRAWYNPLNTSWYSPWQDYASPKIVNSSLGAIITNTST